MTAEGRAPDTSEVTATRRVRFDLGARPFLVLLELTRACDLACRHCRAESAPDPEPDELSTDEVLRVIDDLASLGSPRPHLVFTGGDPLKREDLSLFVEHAATAGLAVAVSPAGTPRASTSRLRALREAGARAVSLSLDGGSRVAQDAFRGVSGSFGWTVAAARASREVGLRLQVNTTVCTDTVHELPAIARLVAEMGVNLWSVFFLVPVGRGQKLQALSAEEVEDVLAFLRDVAAVVPLKTTEAPAFRRVLNQGTARGSRQAGALYAELRRELEAAWQQFPGGPLPPAGRAARPASASRPRRRSPLAVGDGRGVVFVSRRGDVQPSGFLPLVAGNVRELPLSVIYAQSPLLQRFREPSALTGRCGRCEFGDVCGGSRAQAFARTGDPFGEDPTCAYEPAAS